MVGRAPSDDGFLYLSEFHPFTWVFAEDDLTTDPISDVFSAVLGAGLRLELLHEHD